MQTYGGFAEGEAAVSLASFKGAARIWMEKKSRIPVKLELTTDIPLIGTATATLVDCDKDNPLRKALQP